MLRLLALSALIACADAPKDPGTTGSGTTVPTGTTATSTTTSTTGTGTTTGTTPTGTATGTTTTPPDTTPPTWSSALVATGITDAEITVSWTPPADADQQELTVDGVGIALAGTVAEHTLAGLDPQTEHSFSVEAADVAGNWSTDGPDLTVSTACLPPDYEALLAANSDIEAATVGALDPDTLARLCWVVRELEATGEVLVDEPAASVACVEPAACNTIVLTADEKIDILAAKVGHALWLDVNQLVPWRLADYDATELEGLFDPMVVLNNGTSFRYVVDHSPSEAWAYLRDNGLLGADVSSTMTLVFEDFRTTDTTTSFLHGISGRDPTDTAVTLNDALTTWTTGTSPSRTSRSGCQSMSRILLGVLRSANIPGVERHSGQWYPFGHSTPEWPAFEGVVPHGDDLYGATLRAAPSSELLVPFAFYSDPANTAVCGSDSLCLSRRHRALLAIDYPDRWVSRRCCDPAGYGHASCLDYLTSDYAAYLTAGEISAGASAITATCPP